MKFILREGMFISEFHQLAFHMGATEKGKAVIVTFLCEALLIFQKLYFYSGDQRVTDRIHFL